MELLKLFNINSNTKSTIGTITGLPLPTSGNYDGVPAAVVAAALGRIVHFLVLVSNNYLNITSFPYPMTYNSSFSTIGSEGATCHTLYPDGSLGFEKGLVMLQTNVEFVCEYQGTPSDLIGNLAKLRM